MGSNGNGQVRFLSAPAVSSMNVCDGFDGDARRDLAGDVAAHAVGDDEQAEVGAGAVAVLVAAAPEAGVGANGPGQRMRRHGASALRRRHALSADTAGELSARLHLQPHQRLHERHPRALVVDVRLRLCKPLLGAPLGGLGARRRRCLRRARPAAPGS